MSLLRQLRTLSNASAMKQIDENLAYQLTAIVEDHL
jgi:hypothetical protein